MRVVQLALRVALLGVAAVAAYLALTMLDGPAEATDSTDGSGLVATATGALDAQQAVVEKIVPDSAGSDEPESDDPAPDVAEAEPAPAPPTATGPLRTAGRTGESVLAAVKRVPRKTGLVELNDGPVAVPTLPVGEGFVGQLDAVLTEVVTTTTRALHDTQLPSVLPVAPDQDGHPGDPTESVPGPDGLDISARPVDAPPAVGVPAAPAGPAAGPIPPPARTSTGVRHPTRRDYPPEPAPCPAGHQAGTGSDGIRTASALPALFGWSLGRLFEPADRVASPVPAGRSPGIATRPG